MVTSIVATRKTRTILPRLTIIIPPDGRYCRESRNFYLINTRAIHLFDYSIRRFEGRKIVLKSYVLRLDWTTNRRGGKRHAFVYALLFVIEKMILRKFILRDRTLVQPVCPDLISIETMFSISTDNVTSHFAQRACPDPFRHTTLNSTRSKNSSCYTVGKKKKKTHLLEYNNLDIITRYSRRKKKKKGKKKKKRGGRNWKTILH